MRRVLPANAHGPGRHIASERDGFRETCAVRKQTIDKKYKVVYVDNNKNLLLWDEELKSSVQANQVIKSADKINIRMSDTVLVSF
jgi:hypothetical protein